jgi:branched-chain amino acid transport system substrate-binding protein
MLRFKLAFVLVALWAVHANAVSQNPILIGLTAEFGMQNSQSAQSIEKGVLLAIDEINASGGVLGRKLALEKRDDRGLPARAVDNLNEIAENKNVVAVLCGRFSPAALELAPVANRIGLPLLDPWAAADSITTFAAPNYVFRLSMTDTWALGTLLGHAQSKGFKKLMVVLPNTSWGRSGDDAVKAQQPRGMELTRHWYNWGDTEFLPMLVEAKMEGAQAIILVANETEGSLIVKQMASLPEAQRLPIISHWGIVGGNFVGMAGEALNAVDLVVVQTFGFNGRRGQLESQVRRKFKERFGADIDTLQGQVGFAHAYDLTHLLAIAIKKAGCTDRAAIRTALEKTNSYDGLVRHYTQPFSATDHEALDRSQLYLARYGSKGNLIPMKPK